MEELENSGTELKTHRRSIRRKALSWFTLIFTIMTILSYLMFAWASILEANKLLKEDLIQALDGTAQGVDVNMLLDLAQNGEANSEGFSDDPRYLALLEWLDTIHQIDPDVWPYLYIESEEPGNIYLVVDLYALYDQDISSRFMELYESQSGYILVGLDQQTFRAVNPTARFFENLADRAEENDHPQWQSFYTGISEWVYDSWLFPGRDFGTYTDKFGRWASGYTPLTTAPGQPRAGLGMDYQAEMVEQLHNAVRARLAVFYAVTYLVGFLVLSLFTGRLTRPIIALQRKAEQYGNEGSPAVFSSRNKKKHPDEIDDLEDVLVQMVEKIRRRDQRYEAVVDSQSELILRWKPDGAFTFINPVFEEYFLESKDGNQNDLTFENIFIHGHRSTKFLKKALLRLSQSNPFVSLEIPVLTSKLGERCIQFNIRALFSTEGVLEEYQAVGRDISEMKRINAELDEANQQLQHLNRLLLNGREQDRAEFARELHDEILNYISELFMSVTDKPSDSAQEIYHKLVEKVRSTIYDLRPPMLNYGLYLGLEDFVDGLCERYGSDANLQFNIQPSEIRFDPSVEIQIFRIIQEVCSNALMHSEASQVKIDGEITSGRVFISVEDDGLGFEVYRDSEYAAYGSGMKFGLVGMEERAGLIGADLQVNSVPEQGTKIELSWEAENESKSSVD